MPEHGYWNHNAAYHHRLVRIAAERAGDVLDVGCGEGLLAQRLAPVSRTVTAIDPDAAAVRRAVARVGHLPNVTVAESSFETFDPGGQRFDVVTFVASLHHMDLHASLTKARSLVQPHGTLAVVGVAANHSVADWVFSAMVVPVVRIAGLVHSETRDIGVVVAEPRESLSEIRRTAAQVLPGASVRRGLYYRYLLRWTNC
ncbi:class I SAM-dependent methyltransferase [Mycobacterium sp. BMJ-28]